MLRILVPTINGSIVTFKAIFALFICSFLLLLTGGCAFRIGYSEGWVGKGPTEFWRFSGFLDSSFLHNDIFYGTNESLCRKFKACVLGKPSVRLPSIPRNRIPKSVALDYENLLRCHDPSVINYNTRLTDFPGVDIREIDDIYGRIYDRRVLIRQLRYFLERDDFHSVPRLLRDNRFVLNKEDCQAFMNDIDHLLFMRLKYRYPEKNNMEEQMRFLVGRYVSQHLLQQDLESRRYYVWMKPGEIPPEVPDYTEDYREPVATSSDPIRVEDTTAYRQMVTRMKNLDESTRLKMLRELYVRLISSKRSKLLDCLWKYQKLKPFKRLTYIRKVRNKINIDRISPFLARPLRCTDEIVREYTNHFSEALYKGDLATSCWILKKYTRRIDWKNNIELLKKLLELFEEVHRCRKYNEKGLKLLRGLYRTTLKTRKVLIKFNEPLLVRDAGRTMKEMYEEQLENYRRRRDMKNEELMRKKGINMDDIRDFSNAYGEDWIPILYPKEYEQGIKIHEARLEKLREKARKLRSQEQLEDPDDDIESNMDDPEDIS